ncbi:MAG: family 10 glycosylhydrolase [Myxococcales bacterium]|nr:family 10 glycosylhydrolase [Myxococcales bacterium]
MSTLLLSDSLGRTLPRIFTRSRARAEKSAAEPLRGGNRPNACTRFATLLLVLLAGASGGGCGNPAGTPGGSPGDPESAPPRRALWVLAEGHVRSLDAPERIPLLVERAQALAATDLFVQVHRAGRAWYNSSYADAAPYHAVLDATGVDGLALLLEEAHQAGLRVHAWVNVLSLARNREAPILDRLGEQAVVADRWGRSLLDYPDYDVPFPDRRTLRMGSPSIYLDPALPGLAEDLAATYAELLARYPTLDGLHLDYIRYPDVLPFSPGSRFGVGLDFGYGAASRERFLTETGKTAPFGDSLGNANLWDEWRRARTTDLVAQIASEARAVKPDLEISAAVWMYANRAYLALGQDWRGWLEAGLLDFAVPMTYTLDDRLLRYQVEHFAGLAQGARIWPGLGIWLFSSDPQRAIAQLRILRESGVPGEALFSYDSIVAEPELFQVLVETPSP